jgi:hypothetical protein
MFYIVSTGHVLHMACLAFTRNNIGRITKFLHVPYLLAHQYRRYKCRRFL